MSGVRLLLAQLNFVVGDIEANRDQILAACQTATRIHNADVIIFPELALTGYPPEDLLLRAELYDRCEASLQAIAASVASTSGGPPVSAPCTTVQSAVAGVRCAPWMSKLT